jgi:hypothetical protein
MPVGLPVALALLAEAAGSAPADAPPAEATQAIARGYGPAAPDPPKKLAKADDGCAAAAANTNSREIVICAQRPSGYRLNPDVLEAKREMRQSQAGRPHNPHETYRDNPCSTVGPMGCRGGAQINILAAAATAVTMAKRLSKGEEIGSMFETDPHPSEYQLYKEAKARREAKEAEAAAKAKAKAKPTLTILPGTPPPAATAADAVPK